MPLIGEEVGDARQRPEASGFPGAVAQLGERQLCKLDVVGSNPISSTPTIFPDEAYSSEGSVL